MRQRLVLGTAQLGMTYGINNHEGKPTFAHVKDIIQSVYDAGIREFDTAQSYGDCEEILGQAFDALGINDQVKIISKLHVLMRTERNELVAMVAESLKRLRIKRLEVLLLHDESLLDLWDSHLYSMLKECLAHGHVKALGISVYNSSRALQAIKMEGISYIQIPSSILDQRFEQENIFHLARNAGKMIYVRSIFLQGLLLMPPESIPLPLAEVKPTIAALSELAGQWNISIQALSLGYALSKWPYAKIIFGVDTKAQAEANIKAVNLLSDAQIYEVERLIPRFNEHILNPALWKK